MIKLDSIVPWGRSFDEYVRMLDLRPHELTLKILDCAGGPSSFNAEMHERGHRVVSCDPLYAFPVAAIAQRISETLSRILDATRANRHNFLWRDFPSPNALAEARKAAMDKFLQDLPIGLSEGRYCTDELPTLSFPDSRFDLALCSHFLFTYSSLLGLELHLASIREMCRVAAEARIFPLVEQFANGRSPLLAQVIEKLRAEGYRCEIRRVPYEFQIGGNEMLSARC